MSGILTKRDDLDLEAHREGHMKTKAETRVMILPSQGALGWPANSQTPGTGVGWIHSWSPPKGQTLGTPNLGC
jgi:hypothetical protein